jgi:hypothetical protein
VGDKVIRDVKSLVPYGAANQKSDVKNSDHNGETVSRTMLAHKMSTRIGGFQQTANGLVMAHFMRMAGAALTFGAGNCQDQAAVAYSLLRERVDDKTYVSFCVYRTLLFGHAFAAIGRPYVDPDDEVVIVDPWPIHAQAVLWKDHFCYEQKKSSDFQIVRAKVGGKKQGRYAKHDNLKAAIDGSQEIEKIINIDTQFDQQYCSKSGKMIKYAEDLISFD